MARSFKLPDLGEGLTEGEVARWLVSEGQEIAEDDPLVEIQTDKATVEIPSPYAGTVLRILVAEGEVAPVGAALVVDRGAGGGRPGGPPLTRRLPPIRRQRRLRGHFAERVQATPVVRKIAQELGVDIGAAHRHRPGWADHRGRRARRRAGGALGGTARAAARRPADRRRAHGARAPRGRPGHLGRGVRLRGRRARNARRRRREGVRGGRWRSSRS